MATTTLEQELRARFGESVVQGVPSMYLADQTESRGLHGRADAVIRPGSAAEVADVVAWCYARDVPIVPRGGGTGYAAGAVPRDGGVVLALERLDSVRSFDPLLWRVEVEAGVTTAALRQLARGSGLLFPPDPGAAEQSQVGGNVATNAGGPHAFKYGVTGAWVTGLEAVVAPGELVRFGGPIRKDVAGYDLKSLLVGSEGTLGIVTSIWFRLVPAPEASLPAASFHADTAAGCAAIERVLGNGLAVSAIEYLDNECMRLAAPSFPGPVPDGAFMVLVDVDGSREETARLSGEVREVLAQDALAVWAPATAAETTALWRWRDGVSLAVQALRGGKVSEDIVVPLDRLAEAIEGTIEIGRRHGLDACSWGHAGDGNLHSTFLVARDDAAALARAAAAAQELFALAIDLGGSISGEHGVGIVKNGQLEKQWSAAAMNMHRSVKLALDPKGLFNPGKKA